MKGMKEARQTRRGFEEHNRHVGQDYSTFKFNTEISYNCLQLQSIGTVTYSMFRYYSLHDDSSIFGRVKIVRNII